MRVLFVCSGNICRSPMAERYLAHLVEQEGFGQVAVDSAGTLEIHGAPASDEAVAVMREIGVDLSDHLSKGLGQARAAGAELVIGMTREHLEAVARRFPETDGRRFLLRAFERGTRPDAEAADLDDPISRPVEVYREQREMMQGCLGHLIAYIRAGS